MQINELKKYVSQVLQESTLSRLYEHISEHDCAILTAFRNDPFDNSMCGCREDSNPAPATYQKTDVNEDWDKRRKSKDVNYKINKLNNRDLKAKLLDYGYGVTAVEGSYIENFGSQFAKKPKSEDSLFVVNISDADKELFISSIVQLGSHYCQDSIMIIPKGGKDAYFIGTNKSDFPGCDETVIIGDIDYGRKAEFMTQVRGRPMTTKMNESLQTYKNLSRLEKMAVRSLAKKV